MVLSLGEPPRRFLFYFHFVVDVLHFVFDLHFIVICRFYSFTFCFSTSSLSLPWTITRFLDPFYTFSPAHRRVIPDTFIFNHSIIFLPRALRFWVDVFYLQALFYLTLLHRQFWLNLCLSSFPGSRQFFLEICRASYWPSKHRPGPSVCLIYSNPQKIYIQ